MKQVPKLEILPIDTLTPYANNARTHSDDQIKKIQASLREFGFVNPVLIDANRGVIAGHGRIEAAKREGMTEVPCVFVEHLTDAQKRAYILADNRLAELAGWNIELLQMELLDLEANFDMSDFGFEIYPPTWRYDFSEFDEENDSMHGMEEVPIAVTVPAKHREAVNDYLRNGEDDTAIGRGLGVLRRCGLR